jgi:hypothetical protein
VEELWMTRTTYRFNCLLCVASEGYTTGDPESFFRHQMAAHGIDVPKECAQRVVTSVGQGEVSIEFFEFIHRWSRKVIATLKRERGIRREGARV